MTAVHCAGDEAVMHEDRRRRSAPCNPGSGCENRVMLIPRFSLGWLFSATTVLAVFFLVVTLAVEGRPWAIGVSVAFSSLVVIALVHALMFALIWPITEHRRRVGRVRQPTSPFATELPPPQILPPDEPSS